MKFWVYLAFVFFTIGFCGCGNEMPDGETSEEFEKRTLEENYKQFDSVMSSYNLATKWDLGYNDTATVFHIVVNERSMLVDTTVQGAFTEYLFNSIENLYPKRRFVVLYESPSTGVLRSNTISYQSYLDVFEFFIMNPKYGEHLDYCFRNCNEMDIALYNGLLQAFKESDMSEYYLDIDYFNMAYKFLMSCEKNIAINRIKQHYMLFVLLGNDFAKEGHPINTKHATELLKSCSLNFGKYTVKEVMEWKFDEQDKLIE
jgi:hypothetical protein